VAVDVDPARNEVCGPVKVQVHQLDAWRGKHLTKNDAVAMKITTNSWLLHNLLEPYVPSVTVAHSPHVALITRVRVNTHCKQSALHLNFICGFNNHPPEVRIIFSYKNLIAYYVIVLDIPATGRCKLIRYSSNLEALWKFVN